MENEQDPSPEPFCRAPNAQCYQLPECYANKCCQHFPIEGDEDATPLSCPGRALV